MYITFPFPFFPTCGYESTHSLACLSDSLVLEADAVVDRAIKQPDVGNPSAMLASNMNCLVPDKLYAADAPLVDVSEEASVQILRSHEREPKTCTPFGLACVYRAGTHIYRESLISDTNVALLQIPSAPTEEATAAPLAETLMVIEGHSLPAHPVDDSLAGIQSSLLELVSTTKDGAVSEEKPTLDNVTPIFITVPEEAPTAILAEAASEEGEAAAVVPAEAPAEEGQAPAAVPVEASSDGDGAPLAEEGQAPAAVSAEAPSAEEGETPAAVHVKAPSEESEALAVVSVEAPPDEGQAPAAVPVEASSDEGGAPLAEKGQASAAVSADAPSAEEGNTPAAVPAEAPSPDHGEDPGAMQVEASSAEESEATEAVPAEVNSDEALAAVLAEAPSSEKGEALASMSVEAPIEEVEALAAINEDLLPCSQPLLTAEVSTTEMPFGEMLAMTKPPIKSAAEPKRDNILATEVTLPERCQDINESFSTSVQKHLEQGEDAKPRPYSPLIDDPVCESPSCEAKHIGSPVSPQPDSLMMICATSLLMSASATPDNRNDLTLSDLSHSAAPNLSSSPVLLANKVEKVSQVSAPELDIPSPAKELTPPAALPSVESVPSIPLASVSPPLVSKTPTAPVAVEDEEMPPLIPAEVPAKEAVYQPVTVDLVSPKPPVAAPVKEPVLKNDKGILVFNFTLQCMVFRLEFDLDTINTTNLKMYRLTDGVCLLLDIWVVFFPFSMHHGW